MEDVHKWRREIERLGERLAEYEGVEMTANGEDVTEEMKGHIRQTIQKYQDMIDSYEADNA